MEYIWDILSFTFYTTDHVNGPNTKEFLPVAHGVRICSSITVHPNLREFPPYTTATCQQ